MERWKLARYAIPVGTTLMLMVALRVGSIALALGVLAMAMALSYAYVEWLKRRGEVLQDERTLRIEEMASRRTLQMLILVLAFTVVFLAILSQDRQGLKSAYYLSIVLMVITSIIKLSLRHYYSKVM
ncbi:hypothetical protein PAP_06610 [Palaeococcus pacificus DY20341]|uniref:DUF2178 domain-containing protein n=1 Tax=Palaeococcus pacificus DY20341 TaxID=1343739 RepID=A0A075LYS0_9EURY|nr:DUF2178 domain-containing protein [Palaeococcus pacificus]AIF69718.1 hypothetical protein PAP_06610 [Palaeococcus pacificus DY20341]